MSPEDTAAKRLPFTLALTACATLMLQSGMTRIFSVTLSYHMSLLVIALAMFGLTSAAVTVYRFKNWFRPELVALRCAQASTAFGWTVLISLWVATQMSFSIRPDPYCLAQLVGLGFSLGLPFFFSGMVVCLCLTSFPQRVGLLYACDLVGAAWGCLLVVALMTYLDAPTAILCVASLGCLAGWFLAWRPCQISTLLLLGLAAANPSTGWCKINSVMGSKLDRSSFRHELWNAFSYVTVTQPAPMVYLWGPGDKVKQNTASLYGEAMLLTMDTRAGTALVHFDGDWSKVAYLLEDVVNAVHSLRSDGPALVVGVGGGRDILSSLILSQGHRAVTGLEINPTTYKLITTDEANYINLSSIKGVRLIHDEARSWIARSADRFQVITIPLVDTFASSAAGAFALTENSLYTREAFENFYGHLTDDGILCVSRWWHSGRLGETHRLVAMAASALKAAGVSEPKAHIAVLRGSNLATLLVFRSPISAQDEQRLNQICQGHGFELMVAPHGGKVEQLQFFADGNFSAETTHDGQSLLDLSPPTDDRPYFFHCYALSNLLRPSAWTNDVSDMSSASDQRAMQVLTLFTCATPILSGLLLLPMVKEIKPSSPPAVLYFGCIGIGYMLVESSQIGRLTLFLGYPIYALTVVLFTLLVSSGAASWLTQRPVFQSPQAWHKVTAMAALVIGISALSTPWVISSFSSSPQPVRILLAVLLVAPVGLCLGMMYPLGIKNCAQGRISPVLAWVVNGVCSAPAALCGVTLLISWGAQSTYLLALFVYALAGLAAWSATRK